MKKFLTLVAISIALVSFGQNNTSKSVLIENQQKNINNIINIFSKLNHTNFDNNVKNQFYTHLSNLDYLGSENDKLTLVSFFSLTNPRESFYTNGTGLQKNNSFNCLNGSNIVNVEIDTSFTKPNPRSQLIGYYLLIIIDYSVDSQVKRIATSFTLTNAEITSINISEIE